MHGMRSRTMLLVAASSALALVAGAVAAQSTGGFPWDRVVGIDPGTLQDSQRDRVVALAGSTPNYFGCRGTVTACIARDPADPTARRLAGYIARRVKAGATDEQISEGVLDRRRSAHPARTAEIDIIDAPCTGPANAAVTVVEFGEYECPFCREAKPFVDRIVRARADRVRFCFKFFPVRSHARAVPACVAALAARLQDKFWQMHDALFASAPNLSDEAIAGCAGRAGLDMARFRSDISGDDLEEEIEADKLEGQELGVDRTPTFFINGKRYFGEMTEAELADRIDEEIETP